ncbi:Rid family hydrolase, partial [Morganella morganii]|uniref:Rid family hydrolase n=1 Tax=Morganella morganii TaxID=582 RepID=UPI001F0A0BBB
MKNIERDFAAFNEVWVQWMPEDDIVLQTREVLEKIDALLAAAGSDKQHILSAQIWLKNIERDFAAFNEVWVQ